MCPGRPPDLFCRVCTVVLSVSDWWVHGLPIHQDVQVEPVLGTLHLRLPGNRKPITLDRFHLDSMGRAITSEIYDREGLRPAFVRLNVNGHKLGHDTPLNSLTKEKEVTVHAELLAPLRGGMEKSPLLFCCSTAAGEDLGVDGLENQANCDEGMTGNPLHPGKRAELGAAAHDAQAGKATSEAAETGILALRIENEELRQQNMYLQATLEKLGFRNEDDKVARNG